jgi:hypothetical protein
MARRNSDYTKFTSFSPKQRLPLSPSKPWSDRLRISSYYSEGRNCGPSDTRTTAPRPEQTWNVQKLKDI